MIRRPTILQRYLSAAIKREIEVQVTPEDIFGGVPCDASKCPIARALSRATGLPAHVDKVQLSQLGDHFLCGMWLPNRVGRFIYNFDTKRWPQWFWCRPFKFKVKLPAYLVK